MDVQEVISIAKKAGKAVLEVYNKDFEHEFKEDESPLTEADKRSHEVIAKDLRDYPVVSEESSQEDYSVRKDWERFWLIDPLDGTKEFINRNGEFTINIALVENGVPVMGVVYVPVKDLLYYSDGVSSYKKESGEEPVKLPIESEGERLRVVASRSHFNDETKEYIEKLSNDYELVNAGSSIKLCLVAEGKADVYPRLGPTMEWDTAAAHAVVRGAGKEVLDYNTGEELKYNKEDLKNPYFVVK